MQIRNRNGMVCSSAAPDPMDDEPLEPEPSPDDDDELDSWSHHPSLTAAERNPSL